MLQLILWSHRDNAPVDNNIVAMIDQNAEEEESEVKDMEEEDERKSHTAKWGLGQQMFHAQLIAYHIISAPTGPTSSS